MKIDPEARSSMWEDLQRGRRTEIDYLQGVITEIAERRGLEAPLSRRIVELIRQAERDAKGSPGLTPEQIRAAELTRARALKWLVAREFRSAATGEADETNRSGAARGCRRCSAGLSLIPAHAVPPTVTPSPGYDARLQEQRAASRASRSAGRQAGVAASRSTRAH